LGQALLQSTDQLDAGGVDSSDPRRVELHVALSSREDEQLLSKVDDLGDDEVPRARDGRGHVRLGSSQNASNRRDELGGLEGLHQPSGRPRRFRLVLSVGADLCRENEYGRELVARKRSELAYELETVHPRHVDVREHQPEFLAARHVEGLDAIDGLEHLESGFGQGAAHERTHRRRVVYGENPLHRASTIGGGGPWLSTSTSNPQWLHSGSPRPRRTTRRSRRAPLRRWGRWYPMQSLESQSASSPEAASLESVDELQQAAQLLVERLGQLKLEDLDGARPQITRARSLLQDAVASLNHSFAALTADTSEQRTAVSSLLLDMSGEVTDPNSAAAEQVSLQRFIRQTSDLLSNFADLVAHFSKQSVGIAYRIDDMVDQMKGIFRLIEQVDAIAEDTNILAINAALEAVRAGEKGKGFGVVASEVRTLSRKTKSLNDSIVVEMKGAETSIMAVRSAVGEMASHDMTMALEAKADLDVMIDKLDRMQCDIERTLGEIETFTQRVESSTSDAIRGLQFEDLVGQVLQNVDDRVLRVERALEGVKAAAERDEPVEDRLNRIHEALSAYEDEVGSARAPAVEQTTMDEGEVTFF